jgi:DNA repair protein RecO (recombination protein O)
LEALSRGFYVAELVHQFTLDEQVNREIYRLATETLEILTNGMNLDLALRRFELELLTHTGYRPELRICASCGGAITPVVNHFSPSAGGVVCPACRASVTALRPLTVNALKVLRLLQTAGPAQAQRLQLSPGLAAEIEGHLHVYIRYLLEREPRSRDFIRVLPEVAAEPVLS